MFHGMKPPCSYGLPMDHRGAPCPPVASPATAAAARTPRRSSCRGPRPRGAPPGAGRRWAEAP